MYFDICKKDKNYLELYNKSKRRKLGKEFGDGAAVGKIFEEICELAGQDKIGRKILEIFRNSFLTQKP